VNHMQPGPVTGVPSLHADILGIIAWIRRWSAVLLVAAIAADWRATKPVRESHGGVSWVCR